MNKDQIRVINTVFLSPKVQRGLIFMMNYHKNLLLKEDYNKEKYETLTKYLSIKIERNLLEHVLSLASKIDNSIKSSHLKEIKDYLQETFNWFAYVVVFVEDYYFKQSNNLPAYKPTEEQYRLFDKGLARANKRLLYYEK